MIDIHCCDLLMNKLMFEANVIHYADTPTLFISIILIILSIILRQTSQKCIPSCYNFCCTQSVYCTFLELVIIRSCLANTLTYRSVLVLAAMCTVGENTKKATEYSLLNQDGQDQPAQSACTKKCFRGCFYVFYFFWLFSGQYINFSNKCTCKTKFNCASIVGSCFFIWHSLVYVAYVGITLTVEFSRIANSSYIMDTSSTDNETIICALPQEHWKFTTAFTFSTFSAFFSYVIITIFILFPSICHDCKHGCKPDECKNGKCDHCKEQSCNNECTPDNCKCYVDVTCKCKYFCTTYKKAREYGTLSPYDNDELLTNDGCCFIANYILIMLALSVCGIATSVAYIILVYRQTDCWINVLGITMTVFHLNSQFCAIQSCFIFSKIVYKVTGKLNALADNIDETAKRMTAADSQHQASHLVCSLPSRLIQQEYTACTACTKLKSSQDKITSRTPICAVPCLVYKEKVDRDNYYKLQEKDQEFIRKVKPTLDLFGVWFIFHWIAYAITTMLLSAFIVQVIIDTIRYNIQSVNNMMPKTETDTTAPYVCYVVFFTLVHAFLFLYPCFRAAAIATARAKLIATISNQQWENVSVPIQTNFVRYLTSQNFAFRVSLFCTNISFGFNWVFVSFFIAICGAYLRF